MNLKKLLLLVFIYMMEQEKEELRSSLGELSVGGLIYVAKMVGLNDIGKLMTEMNKIEAIIRKDYAEADDKTVSKAEELFDTILEKFEE